MSEKLWYKVVRNVIKAGQLPIPVNDNVIEILKTLMTEEQAKFTLMFRKAMNIEQIKAKTDLEGEALEKMLDALTHVGIITQIPSQSTGQKVYRLAPFFPGLLEFTLMRGGTGEREKKITMLFDQLFKDMAEGTQRNYDHMVAQFKAAPPMDRVIPVGEEVEVGQEKVYTFEEMSKVLDNTSEIGLATCYCRHMKDLKGQPCKVTDDRKICFMLGRTAEFSNQYGFTEKISVEEAKKIARKCEDLGLVHKAFHIALNPERELDGMCNCCSCCCEIFDIHRRGAFPITSLTSFIARANADNCTGCGTCVEKCPLDALEIGDEAVVVVDDMRCIGCGVCAHMCPEDPKGIELERTGPRNVFIPPPRITQD